jgi:hypothetical protein
VIVREMELHKAPWTGRLVVWKGISKRDLERHVAHS